MAPMLPMARWALPLALLTTAAAADDAALQRCRQIAEPGARLACYDAIAVRPAAAPAPVATGANFGFDAAAPRSGPDLIETTIAGRFEGWAPGDHITLANGQVWRVVDGSSAAFGYVDPKVRIRRGLLGAYYLEIEDSNRSPRVVRTR